MHFVLANYCNERSAFILELLINKPTKQESDRCLRAVRLDSCSQVRHLAGAAAEIRGFSASDLAYKQAVIKAFDNLMDCCPAFQYWKENEEDFGDLAQLACFNRRITIQ